MLLLLMILIVCFFCKAQNIDTTALATMREAKPFIRFGKRESGLVVCLQKLFVEAETFWLEFTITNRSSLSWPLELFRLYIRDKDRTRRSSQQEIELIPLYADTLQLVQAKSTKHFMVALPKFTIPDNKACILELFETNGGRNLALSISNRQLFLARPILRTP